METLATSIPTLQVKAIASQTGALFRWLDASNNTLGQILPNGNMGINTGISVGAKLHINTASTSEIGQIIRGFASQTANLTEWQTSGGTTVDKVDRDGYVRRGNTIVWSEQKTIGTTAGSFSELGTALNTSVGANIEIDVSWYVGNNAESRKYFFSNAYTVLSGWTRASPLSEWSAYTAPIDLEVASGTGAGMKFRVRNRIGAFPPSNVKVTYKITSSSLLTGNLATVWTASSVTGTDTTTLNPYPYTTIRQRNGELHVVNTSASSGRSRIVTQESAFETGTGGKGLSITNNGDVIADGAVGNVDTRIFGLNPLLLPNATNDYIEFCSILSTSLSANIEIMSSVRQSGFATSKKYILPIFYAGTAGTWQKCIPMSSTGAFAGNDYDIEVNITTNTAVFRARRVSGGVTSASLFVTVAVSGGSSNAISVTQTAVTGTGTAPTSAYAPTSLCQINGRTGIGGLNADNPHVSAILDLSGDTTKAFILPKLTTAQRTAITSPTGGMMVYDTDTNKSYTYDGTTWQSHY